MGTHCVPSWTFFAKTSHSIQTTHFTWAKVMTGTKKILTDVTFAAVKYGPETLKLTVKHKAENSFDAIVGHCDIYLPFLLGKNFWTSVGVKQYFQLCLKQYHETCWAELFLAHQQLEGEHLSSAYHWILHHT